MSGREIKVFTSYSHQPTENADFVRELSARLRAATHAEFRFDVWLDEERMPGGVDFEDVIAKVIPGMDAALFVVNERWLGRKRTHIRREVRLFEDLGVPMVVLQREDIEANLLDHSLLPLNRLSWYDGDTSPDERFWEVVCGLTGTPPGPHKDWARKGREITGAMEATEQSRPAAVTGRSALQLAVKAKPVAAFPAGNRTYLVTAADEWVTWCKNGHEGTLLEAPCEYAAALADERGGLLLAGYDGVVSRANGSSWKLLGDASPALCMARSPDGELIGTASGHILLARTTSLSSVARMRDPVIALTATESGVYAVGARGAFGRFAPGAANAQLEWLDAGELTQPSGFFEAVEATSLGVAGSTRLALIEVATGRMKLLSCVIEDGVRQVAFLGAGNWPYAVLTDAGGVVWLDSSLCGVRAVRFPKGAVITGCLAVVELGLLLAWSAAGVLFRVGSDCAAERVADGGVALAYTAGEGGSVELVRWSEAAGTSVETLELAR